VRRSILFALAACLLTFSTLEFWKITWGTGNWLGLFSFKWFVAFLLFALFCVFCLTTIFWVLWQTEWILQKSRLVIPYRNLLGKLRWALVILLLLVPPGLLQYTAWGIILDEPYLRIMIWAVTTFLISLLLSQSEHELITWNSLLAALTLVSGTLVAFASLREVTSYPFSLGWSEGNRLWDYSVLFGHAIYDYPAGQKIPVLLDIGRQFIGGIPFLIPGITIWQARLWNALVNVIPYLLLGSIAFKTSEKNNKDWILAGVWAMTFVLQGPIHPPLLLCAILVAFAWRKPLWLSIPLIVIASYFAAISRFTWLFAPGMWIGMLELSSAATQNNQLDKTAWGRAVSTGLAGVLSGYFAPGLITRLTTTLQNSGTNAGGGLSVSSVGEQISVQALLWYRLFPNATYGYGILIGLFLAIAPLTIILLHLSDTRRWNMTLWQKLAIILSLLAFLVVGLIVSVKIGGGGDLHNMDMFIIGALFAAAIAWHNGGRTWIKQISTSPTWIHTTAVLLLALPAYSSLMYLKPISIHEDVNWVKTLADIPLTSPIQDILASDSDTNQALDDIRNEVERASSQGSILFMDQRQLLTFGYIKNVPLIPEYDKKVLINQALSADAQYFSGFYKDLAAQRFSLIISNPLNENIQTDQDQFGEENNAWVTWVSIPVLCYYEPLNTYKKITVQLLVPRQDISGCEQKLPTAVR